MINPEHNHPNWEIDQLNDGDFHMHGPYDDNMQVVFSCLEFCENDECPVHGDKGSEEPINEASSSYISLCCPPDGVEVLAKAFEELAVKLRIFAKTTVAIPRITQFGGKAQA